MSCKFFIWIFIADTYNFLGTNIYPSFSVSGDITKTIITKLSPKRSNRKKGGNGSERRSGNDPIELDWSGDEL